MVAHAPAPHGGACAWFARELNIDKTGLKIRARSEGARHKRKRARQEPGCAYPAKLSRIKIATNPCLAERTKHFDIKYHWLREKVKSKDVELKYISTHDQLADIFTKSLGERQHTKLRGLLTGF